MPDRLPTASMNGITAQPYEVLTITPSNWLDLDNAEITIERRTPDIIPPGQVATFNGVSQNGKVRLTWTPPAEDGGAVIEEYIIYRGPLYNEMNQYRTVPGTVRTFLDEDVVIGETYFYAIAAINHAGEGRKSPAVGVWVQQGPGMPSMPRNLVATPSPGRVRLTWEPPEDDGGAPIEAYVVLRSENEWVTSPPELVRLGNVTSYIDKDVEANTTYYYSVYCINGAGQGMGTGPQTNPVEALVPEGGSGNGGNGDGGDDGPYPIIEYVAVLLVGLAALGGGLLIGMRKG
jgi:hypothetical protein